MKRQRLFAPLSPSFLSDSVSALITEAILSGKVRPGDKLNETQLASDFRVSRTPIRQALQELQEQGLVERRPGRGVSVIRLEQEDVRKINSLRELLEGEALDLCRENLNLAGEKKLIQLVERMESMEPEPLAQAVLLDLQFHRAIWDLTGNQYLCRVLRSISTPLFAHKVTSRPDSAQIRLVLPSHRPLLEFVQGKRSESARELMRIHIQLQWRDAASFSRVRAAPSVEDSLSERAADVGSHQVERENL